MTSELRVHALILLGMVGLMWAAEIMDQVVFRSQLDRLGIRPLNWGQWWGMFLAPFLHGGFAHLLANTVPFLVLGWLVLLHGLRHFAVVFLTAVLIGGIGVFFFGGPNTVHVGASGVVFGFLGFLLLRGYFERSCVSILVAVVVGVMYGGALWGVLPAGPGISWQGHLFGFVGGGTAARALSRRRSQFTPGRGAALGGRNLTR